MENGLEIPTSQFARKSSKGLELLTFTFAAALLPELNEYLTLKGIQTSYTATMFVTRCILKSYWLSKRLMHMRLQTKFQVFSARLKLVTA